VLKFVLQLLGFILAHTPEFLLRAFSVLAGECLLWAAPRRRRLVLSNLDHAFPERTPAWRRDQRRAEYGDERDPATRAWLESISPLAHVAELRHPVLVADGLNDARVPAAESDRLVAALRTQGTPVWHVAARDEGHGFVRKANADYLFLATVEFVKAVLKP